MARLKTNIPAISKGVLPPVQQKLKITILSGGPSDEREVSLKSGAAVAEALRSLGHDVTLADIGPDHLESLEIPADVVFIALHGEFGEDGTVQRILDERGIRYGGSGADASALAMDKAASKQRFLEAGVPTPAFDIVHAANADAIRKSWHAPVVVKPLSGGSSVDCFICHSDAEMNEALTKLLADHERGMIERFVDGYELTVGVLGDQVLPPIEIRTARAFYDYQAKYLDNDTQYLFEIDLPDDVMGRVRELSLQAHEALGCRDFSRVDWLVDRETHEPYALEINTIPGFTDHSLLPKAAGRVGIGFSALCQRIIDMTRQRAT